MHDYNLGFISNEEIYSHVRSTVEAYLKGNAIHIKDLHNKLLESAGHGWTKPKAGFDLVNDESHIYMLIGNNNTASNSSMRNANIRMQGKILEDEKAVCYLMEIDSEESFDEPWIREVDGKEYSHPRIRLISPDRFYALAFNHADAYPCLRAVLPTVFEDALKAGL